ncbi:hypothetical protein N7466_005589 [Penicillium verhagenii]|uniref:uncharacterized protein n=1 Tax=Penicillium verhagenii TaxID=1562060 RepID=UPI0025456B70|nr:uncharacterized protein N7466_005589 [Penicillium verhagenii]KAJ5930096.1 hypothetical protein N7466_005589 [Penicillium verhagenii]
METVRQSCRPKHQVLTLKCYPRYQKGVAEVKPNPSELSYLLYYASTRRSKLTKVGGFLEKRVAKDVWRRRLGNVQVALHILSGLIEKVPRDLPIYVGSVLAVIETVLRSNDISMVEDSIATFETFCRHQDIAIISAEHGIAHKYREVVRLYASFADPSSDLYSPAKVSPPVSIRWRNAGLRAIRSIVSSESLAADGGNSLKIILPVILENLYSADEDVLVPLKARLHENKETDRDGNRAPRRMSAATVHTVDTVEGGDPALAAGSAADVDRKAEMDARLLALRCLERITVSGSNRGQTRVAASIIMQFISNKQFPRTTSQEMSTEPQDGNWATSLIELVANWCPVQVRFLILGAAMDTLFDTAPTEKALDSSFTILSVVDWLLKSSVNMIGLSVMDILLGLMQYASSILSPQESANTENKADLHADTAIYISGRRRSLLTLLEQCIGDLATHIYYTDQVADMTRAILRRFKSTLNHESGAPSALATVHESTASPVAATQSASDTLGEKVSGDAYSHAAARSMALRAVKAIFVVANLTKSASTSETRNPVGIHVWEGTQGLLRDPDREVRHAYADAFLAWLCLETSKEDLKLRNDTPKYVKPSSREQADKPNRRSTSAPGNQREIVAQAAQSTFLRLLHLAIYDAALDSAAVESEILLLHLIMVHLVDNLGVNAIQYGLPMVLKLQDDIATSVELGSSKARINVASLIHGYLLAVLEKFSLESTHAGVEIRNEIERRQSKGQWLSKVRLPPTGLDDIVIGDEKSFNGDSDSSDSLQPFQNIEGLVSGIDESYTKAISSPPQSPPTAPAPGFNFPVLSQPPSTHRLIESGLPSSVKDQMMSPWSRESCLAAVEKESVKTLSLSGSRQGTATRNNNVNSAANGAANGSPAGSATHKNRRQSVPELPRTPEHSSNRGSPVRVTELRRVLSVTADGQQRKLSPLRGHLDASNISIISSGSESMVSGSYAVSEMEPDTTSVHQRDADRAPDGQGSETPRPASVIVLSGDKTPTEQTDSLSRVNSHEIPPVPPIPSNLHIPGGFPNDSQRSLLIDRPSTAPDSRQSSFQGKSGQPQQHTRNKKSLNRNKSRSSNSLAGVDAFHDSNGDSALDSDQRVELKKLLDGFLTPENSLLANGDHPTTGSKAPVTRSYSKRRVSGGGGLGRPPY